MTPAIKKKNLEKTLYRSTWIQKIIRYNERDFMSHTTIIMMSDCATFAGHNAIQPLQGLHSQSTKNTVSGEIDEETNIAP